MRNLSRLIAGSVAGGLAIALFWLRAPIMPALIGAVGAALLLYRRGTVTE